MPGVEGIKGATLPPPGFWLRDYNVALLLRHAERARTGTKINGVDAKAFVYANVPRLLWITDTKVLGGYLGLDALVPLRYTDLNISAGPIHH